MALRGPRRFDSCGETSERRLAGLCRPFNWFPYARDGERRLYAGSTPALTPRFIV